MLGNYLKFLEHTQGTLLNINIHMRLALFRLMIKLLYSPNQTNIEQDKYFDFITGILLDEDNYNKWFSDIENDLQHIDNS